MTECKVLRLRFNQFYKLYRRLTVNQFTKVCFILLIAWRIMNSQTLLLRQTIKQSVHQADSVECPWCKSPMIGKRWMAGRHFKTISGETCKMRSQEAVEDAIDAGVELSVARLAWIPLAVILERASRKPRKVASKKLSKKSPKDASPGVPSSKEEERWVTAKSLRHHRRRGYRSNRSEESSSASSSFPSFTSSVDPYQAVSFFTFHFSQLDFT